MPEKRKEMKISVECTQFEKELITNALANGAVCMFESGDECNGNCVECLEKKVQWKITDQRTS